MRPRLSDDRNNRRQRQLLFCAADRSNVAAARKRAKFRRHCRASKRAS